MKEMTVKEMASLGGHARAALLTKDELSKIGKKAINARWDKERKNNNKWKNKQKKRKSRSIKRS